MMRGAKYIMLFPPTIREQKARADIPGVGPPLALHSFSCLDLRSVSSSLPPSRQLMENGNRYQGPSEDFSDT